MPESPPARVLAAAVFTVLAALLVAACGNDDEGEAASASLPEGCEEAQEPPPKRVVLNPPQRRVPPSRRLMAAVDTSCGVFKIALDARSSPRTVSSFVHLARRGVYDNTIFHGIDPNLLIQGGDPLGTGTGGPGYYVDEPPPSDAEYTKGTVAMAKTDVEPAGRSRSQFFVVVAADAGLPPQYALLGKVSSGQGVVERIARLGDPASETGTPRATVVVRTIEVGEG
jgi:cyclophilin family peptidyl-prolyl cis-trans isomerase